MTAQLDDRIPSKWLHRAIWLALCLIWPLIWVGSLVTTYAAGMSVPDWPNTYGYNLFLYPWKSWVTGPFDLFIEHGHRLLGAAVGFAAIGVVILAWVTERRRWVLGLSVAGLLMVIVQGVLGGIRVVEADRVLAMTHGSTAPLVFSLFTVLVVVTGRWWFEQGLLAGTLPQGAADQMAAATVPPRLPSLVPCITVILLTYMQMVLGAQLRHVSPGATPSAFMHTATTHLALGFLVWGAFAVLAFQTMKCGEKSLSRPVDLLLILVLLQITLGLSTWFVKYGLPLVIDKNWAANYLLTAKPFWGSVIVCSHVATGSFILACAVWFGAKLWRLRHVRRQRTGAAAPSS